MTKGIESALARNRTFAETGGGRVSAVSGHVYDVVTGLVQTIIPAGETGIPTHVETP